MARRRAREAAFQVIFQAESGESPVLETWQETRAHLVNLADTPTDGDADRNANATTENDTEDTTLQPLDGEGLAFADALVHAYAEHHAQINQALRDTIQGWSFSQMAQTDLAVLRLAMTELHHTKDIPPQVTIEMAVRIAKKFGSEESGKFVNGVLASYYRSQQAKSSSESAALAPEASQQDAP